ncbi:MAG: hypothetical protein EBW96_04555 [Actinobacteria bacterium]|nr:hypothetical protein [Actinomycetota bacterium]
MNDNKPGSALSLLREIITLLLDHIKINLKVFEDNLVRIKEIDTAIQQHTFIDEEGDETYDSVGMELYREKRKLEEINSKTKKPARRLHKARATKVPRKPIHNSAMARGTHAGIDCGAGASFGTTFRVLRGIVITG